MSKLTGQNLHFRAVWTETWEFAEINLPIRQGNITEDPVNSLESFNTFNLKHKNDCKKRYIFFTSELLSWIVSFKRTLKSLRSIPDLGPGLDIVSLPKTQNVSLSFISRYESF